METKPLTAEDREERMIQVGLCEVLYRYEDMLPEIKSLIMDIIHSDQPIPSTDEYQALIEAYTENIYDSLMPFRAANVFQFERQHERHHLKFIENYMEKHMEIVTKLVHEVMDILDEILKVENIPLDDLVNYWRAKAFFISRIRIVAFGKDYPKWKHKALEYFQHAYELSKGLDYPNFTRVYLVSKYASFCHDDCSDAEKALSLAYPEFEELYKHDSALMCRPENNPGGGEYFELRKKIALWKQHTGPDDDE